MASQLLELRPNRDELSSNLNFNGYKLSLKKIPTLQDNLDVPVERVLPSNDQYSFLHAKLFGLHNHLFNDIFTSSNTVYFIDREGNLQMACLDAVSGNRIILNTVFKVPSIERKPGDYNSSLKFATEDLAVLSNGSGLLYILNTGPREIATEWQCVFADEVIDKPFIIQDAISSEKKLQCLLLTVELDNVTNKNHLAVLHWLTLVEAEDGSWGAVELRELKGRGDLHYAYLEPSCDAVYIVSDRGFKFTADSENPIKTKPDLSMYEWEQTENDVILKFPLLEEFKSDDISVDVKSSEILIHYQNDVVLKARLNNNVLVDSSTWIFENNALRVVLVKEAAGFMWEDAMEIKDGFDLCLLEETRRQLEGFGGDEKSRDPHGGHEPMYSRQQIEECDLEDDKLVVFERISCGSHKVTHFTNFPPHHLLLTTTLTKGLPPALAIRYDVDGCLWQPLLNKDTNEFSLHYESTLAACGYIQASKQQRKFSVCAPDFSYFVISEPSRHVFIYRQNKLLESAELRNRRSGRRVGTTFEQYVYNISDEEVLGISALNDMLFLLTQNSIISLKL